MLMDMGMRIVMELNATESYISGRGVVGPGDLVRVAQSPPLPAVAGIALSSCKDIKAGFDDGTRGKGVSRPPNIPIRLGTWIRYSTVRPLGRWAVSPFCSSFSGLLDCWTARLSGCWMGSLGC